ncbi:MAG: hypothetical protein EOO29_06405 [Comamonadaceae bacterium]|nr:MAG: hypothetical protein EOO29_06405 [Comamonadaceae bacterium]
MHRPIFLRRLFILIVNAAVLAACWLLPMDRYAREQVSAGLQRSLTAFAAARTLGAAVSVVQSVRVEAVVGVSPGEALRPLSELIDRFAAVMLAASVAFGVQLLLLGVGGHAAVSAALTLALLAWAWLRWRSAARDAPLGASVSGGRPASPSRTLRWLTPVLVGLLVARFAVPVSALANEAAYRAVMAGEFQGAMASLEGAPAAVEAAPPGTAATKGTLDRLRDLAERVKNTPAVIEGLLQSAKEWATQIVRLMAVFVLQTAVLPLAFLWLFWRLARGLVALPPPAR